MAWFLAFVGLATVGAEVGAGVYQNIESEKTAKETERLQGEWALKESWLEWGMGPSSAPGSIHI